MSRKVHFSPGAPEPIGPYSQAVEANGFIFLSGQIPVDPKTGFLIEGEVKDQTRMVMDNLASVLAAAGCSMKDLVMVTLYIKDMEEFPYVNEVYAGYFGDKPPARACIEVARLPKDVKVEASAVAAVPD